LVELKSANSESG